MSPVWTYVAVSARQWNFRVFSKAANRQFLQCQYDIHVDLPFGIWLFLFGTVASSHACKASTTAKSLWVRFQPRERVRKPELSSRRFTNRLLDVRQAIYFVLGFEIKQSTTAAEKHILF